MSIKPLHVVPEVESSVDVAAPIARVIEWLDARVPLVLKSHRPVGRGSAEVLLLQRARFPKAHWQRQGIPVEELLSILGTIKDEFDWPNSNFIPADPIRLVVLPKFGEESPILMLCLALRERLDVDLKWQDIQQLWVDNKTVGTLVEFIFKQLERKRSEKGVRSGKGVSDGLNLCQ